MNMPKFKKRPLVIEAIQWTGENTEEIKAFTGKRDNGDHYFVLPEDIWGVMEADAWIYDDIQNTTVNVYKGDYIIKGLQGEFYPHEPQLFAKAYEQVDE